MDFTEGTSLLAPTNIAATFHLYKDESQLPHTGRRLYAASSNDPALPAEDKLAVLGALVARKQICISDSLPFSAGVHTCGVRVRVLLPGSVGYADWKHIFVLQRNFVVDYHLR